jgi:DNA-binding HxlR family transcriptional regulator/putative sterol carrier protein
LWYTYSVKTRVYGQFCGFARALDIVGERWAFMVVRDLLIGPKRFSDLLRGLPGIPTNVLTARLKELEEAGLVQRKVLPRPAGSVVYELTERGLGLQETVTALGRWGAKLLDQPRPNEIITNDSIAMALRTTFRPERASKMDAVYELHMGEVVVNARVKGDEIAVHVGAAEKPDVVIEAGPALKDVMAGTLSPRQAIAHGAVRVHGDKKLFDRFPEIFRI